MAVCVLDRRKKPLMPCSEKRARTLLASGRARVHRLIPFTIRLVDRSVDECALQPITIKLDPGSKTTGLALVRESTVLNKDTSEQRTAHVLTLVELTHRGQQIRDALTARRQMRQRRRGHLRYRATRFLNRTTPAGWLAPSLRHRVVTIRSWVDRFMRWAPVTGLCQELVRFDLQQIENPEIAGMEYQHGELAGYEVREYLLAKWGRTCAYCGAENSPLQVEHIHPRARGGSDRVSNLTLACGPCNTRKGTMPVEAFLAKKPDALARILAQAKRSLKDAAAVNSTRWALVNAMKATGLPVTTGSGGLTKFNRARLDIPKTHALDAACVGRTAAVTDWHKSTLTITATGRGSYQRTRLTAHGFPRGYLTRQKRHFGFQTGDVVRAVVLGGKKTGVHVGRVAVRASGRFNIQTPHGVIQGVSHRHCRLRQRADGYGYSLVAHAWKGSEKRGHASRAALSLPGLKAEVSRAN